MNAEYINPFLEAANLVFKEMLGLQLLRGKTSIKMNPLPERDIAILLGVKGPVNGDVIYALNIETVYNVVRKLMPGISQEELENEYRDIIGELSNMITGNALNIFLARHADLDLSVPMVVDNRKGELQFKDRTTIGMNLYSVMGLIEVNVALS